MDTRNSTTNFGVTYFESGVVNKAVAAETDLYYYETFAGRHEIQISRGDCLYWISSDMTTAHLTRGPARIQSLLFATLVRGFAPENKSSTIVNGTNLPYINGCSTKQVFPPERPGDPTMQMLHMPPQTSEQSHHIHSTVRSVFVLAGEGQSIVGLGSRVTRTPLKPGMICILEKMCPHHFQTDNSSLVVLPVHIWSTIHGLENNHPMFNGTFVVG